MAAVFAFGFGGAAMLRCLRSASLDAAVAPLADEENLVRIDKHPDNWWQAGCYEPTTMHIALGNNKFSLMVDPTLPAEAFQTLKVDLQKIAACIPPHALKAISENCHIYVNKDNGDRGACVHWVSKPFETTGGGCTERELSIEIHNWDDYSTSRQLLNREGTLLHEMAHVYNGTLGRDHQPIVDMYDKACASGLYENVKMLNGAHKEAYGIQNHLELFASLSVPLLGGVNDYEPFTKWGLERFDPDSYAALVQIWGLDDAPVALPSKI